MQREFGRHSSKRVIVLLGPQRLEPTAPEAVAPFVGPGDAVSAITAGWEERESELVELREHLGRTVESLDLHRRAQQVMEDDPELGEALKRRRRNLRALRSIYRLRLRHLVPAAEELLRRTGPDDLMVPEREDALQGLRALDAHHLERIDEIHDAFLEEWRPSEREAVARQREELAAILQRTAVLCIAGGHVRILHTRLWLFDIVDLLPEGMPIVAWSAGAMVLAERIVLFHDSPPQGQGHPEVLGPGFGLCPGIVPLPHASRRLDLDDEVRVQLLSRRFPDSICVALDGGSSLRWDGSRWSGPESTRKLTLTGGLAAMGDA